MDLPIEFTEQNLFVSAMVSSWKLFSQIVCAAVELSRRVREALAE